MFSFISESRMGNAVQLISEQPEKRDSTEKWDSFRAEGNHGQSSLAAIDEECFGSMRETLPPCFRDDLCQPGQDVHLLMHGAADKRSPIGHAEELYMGLKKNNAGGDRGLSAGQSRLH